MSKTLKIHFSPDDAPDLPEVKKPKKAETQEAGDTRTDRLAATRMRVVRIIENKLLN